MTTKRGLRIGIDTGGTFTDVVGVRSDTGEVFTTKTPTTPADFSEGLIQGIKKILSETKIRPAMVNGVFHGTTVATNAILERRFEDLGFIVTGGFATCSKSEGRTARRKPTTPPPCSQSPATRWFRPSGSGRRKRESPHRARFSNPSMKETRSSSPNGSRPKGSAPWGSACCTLTPTRRMSKSF